MRTINFNNQLTAFFLKRLLVLVIIASIFQSCQKSSSDPSTSTLDPGIYITFQTESAVTSYTDTNPKVGSNMSVGVSYGPCAAGTYYLTAKLANGSTYTNQAYTLSAPATGFTFRNYTLKFFYSASLNRWLYTYTFVDSN
jgi:hypothetical protein